MKNHKKCTYHSFKQQGKVFLVSLALTWLGLTLITDEPNPGCWPNFLKPMLLIGACLVFGVLTYDHNCLTDHYTDREKNKDN
jgi:hypothetical protein